MIKKKHSALPKRNPHDISHRKSVRKQSTAKTSKEQGIKKQQYKRKMSHPRAKKMATLYVWYTFFVGWLVLFIFWVLAGHMYPRI